MISPEAAAFLDGAADVCADVCIIIMGFYLSNWAFKKLFLGGLRGFGNFPRL